MNPNTGEIKEFDTEEEAKEAGFTIPVERMPDSSCRLCQGRGSILVNYGGKRKRFKPCKCVK